MNHIPRIGELTAAKITVVYVLVGGSWITMTDYLVMLTIYEGQTRLWLQMSKGLLYVGGSAILVYWLAGSREGELQRVNHRLSQALKQNSILHRILRHNIRNTCNVIAGHAELLRGEIGDNSRLSVIMKQTGEMTDMIEKSRHLRNALTRNGTSPSNVDLVQEVETLPQKYPSANLTVDLPDAAHVTAVSPEIVLYELVENAIEHNRTDDAAVLVNVEKNGHGSVSVEVEDNGPGIPEFERDALERETEGPMSHSLGIGLWVAKTLVSESGGELSIEDNSPQGSIVRVTFPKAVPPGGNRPPA